MVREHYDSENGDVTNGIYNVRGCAPVITKSFDNGARIVIPKDYGSMTNLRTISELDDLTGYTTRIIMTYQNY